MLTAVCAHQWEIETADPSAGTGLLSPGTCRLCGESKVFKNFIEGNDRELLIGKADRRRRQKPRRRSK